ncbi:MAG TPA: winged helix-turn-helix domain-containing protein [Candidatus Thermoplasmatota archaeon]|nr:winged helix-turn-helix domain-containing protein [Candidatus Thermoplasmatota archaeon]
MSRRERWHVLGAILMALEAEEAHAREVRMTTVADRANVAHERLRAYLKELHAAELVTLHPRPVLTPRGREFLGRYRRWMETLESFERPQLRRE